MTNLEKVELALKKECEWLDDYLQSTDYASNFEISEQVLGDSIKEAFPKCQNPYEIAGQAYDYKVERSHGYYGVYSGKSLIGNAIPIHEYEHQIDPLFNPLLKDIPLYELRELLKQASCDCVVNTRSLHGKYPTFEIYIYCPCTWYIIVTKKHVKELLTL